MTGGRVTGRSRIKVRIPTGIDTGRVLRLSVEEQQRRVDSQSVGAVPLVVPLTVGPAVLTTIILQANQHGRLSTDLVIVANVLIAGAVFGFSQVVDHLLGRTGIRTISKIASLILAAIAVMMVRLGVSEILACVNVLITGL